MSSLDEAHALVIAVRERGGPGCAIESGAFDAAEYLRDLRQKASTGVNHPVHGPFWRGVQTKYALLEAVLGDHAQRRLLAGKLAAHRAEGQRQALARVTRALDVLCHDGRSALTQQEHDHLIKAYTGEPGVTAAELTRLLTARGITVAASTAASEKVSFLSDGDMARMTTELQVFGAVTLYDFLQVSPSAQLGNIRAAIDTQKSAWQLKRASNEKTSAQSLLSRCSGHFASGAARSRYDLSHAKHILSREGVLHDFELATLDGVLEASELSQLVKHGTALGLTKRHVSQVLVALATTAGVIVREAPKAPVTGRTAPPATGRTAPPAARTASGGSTTPTEPSVARPTPKPTAKTNSAGTPAKPAQASQPSSGHLSGFTVWLVPAVLFVLLNVAAYWADSYLGEYGYYLTWPISAGLVGFRFKRGPQVAITSGVTSWAAYFAYGFITNLTSVFVRPEGVVTAVVVWFSCRALKSRGGSPFFAGLLAGAVAYSVRPFMQLVNEYVELPWQVSSNDWLLTLAAAFLVFALWAYRQGRKGNLSVR